jgi:hypothetical protein
LTVSDVSPRLRDDERVPQTLIITQWAGVAAEEDVHAAAGTIRDVDFFCGPDHGSATIGVPGTAFTCVNHSLCFLITPTASSYR